MSYSIGSREQENNSLTNIWFGPIQARIQLPNQIEPAIDLIVDKRIENPRQSSRFDFDRYGLVPRSSPRQADLILTAGTVTMKMAPSLVRLYEQMPEPKYVIAMGACTITGGMFSTDSYSTVRGVDKLIPVDVYLPGCPPKPEAVIDAITKLRKKISREIFEDRTVSQQENRCFTTNHKFCVRRSTHTGNYDQELLYQSPSTSEIPSETFFKSKSSVSPHELVNQTSLEVDEVYYITI
ncbi:hypothetical protein C4D60_Mb00t08930 [Musa balbisiana]|uniref:NADH:ubiquinone oxidoreductase-like 20kDa subunit domain-containing protein n=1 Tax=Musa balbisiana TaxID=52838 RepID=A0A4S8I692_MUSBA|nr:hypothetical protein C4D60_Mb00t08930 [Musa balbisiana]